LEVFFFFFPLGGLFSGVKAPLGLAGGHLPPLKRFAEDFRPFNHLGKLTFRVFFFSTRPAGAPNVVLG